MVRKISAEGQGQLSFFEDVREEPPALPAGPPPACVPAAHREAMRLPRPGLERALVSILRGLAEYAQAHRSRYGAPIADCGYLGPEWSAIVSHTHSLLNGELGRLDGGEFSRQLYAMIESEEGVAEALAATDPPKAPLVQRATKGRSDTVEAVAIGTKRLTERQRDLLNLIRVNEDNLAVYTGQEHIPDWAALKSVMVALGGKWKTKKGFVFPEDVDARELVRLALESGEILDEKEAEFFETSDALADELAEWVDPQPGEVLLEPNAGRGAIVRALLRKCPDIGAVRCCEPMPKLAAELKELPRVELYGQDFMRENGIGQVDGCAMNPPFSKRQDIRHITRAFELVRPGGKLAAIASAGVEYRQDAETVAFRRLIESHGGTINRNPERSFAHVGTDVSTVMIRVQRRSVSPTSETASGSSQK